MAQRTPISAGNWKMHTSNAEADALCDGLAGIGEIAWVEVVLAPSFLQIERVAKRLAGTGVGVAAQNMHAHDSGTFTGEVSARQVQEVADWVILGHSERRQLFCEDDAGVNAKVQAALRHGLTPIICVGERGEEREAERTEAVLRRQVMGALRDVTVPRGLVIAYEPVWAIGTGKAASGEIAQEAVAYIRSLVAESSDAETAASARILYGGSVKVENIPEFIAQPDVDGALVGGASLDAAAFLAITRAIAAAKSE